MLQTINLSTNIFNDEKIKVIRNFEDGNTFFLVWIGLLTLAGHSDKNGLLCFTKKLPHDEFYLSALLQVPFSIVESALNTFEEYGMIMRDEFGIHITNWSKYQTSKEEMRLKERE